MNDPVTNLVVTVLAAMLFGSVSASLVSHFLSSRRENKEFRLKKLEELYNAVQDAFVWGGDLRALYLSVTMGASVFDNDIAMTAKCDEIDNRHCHAYKNLMVISDIWFPALKEPAQQLINSVQKMSLCIMDTNKRWMTTNANPSVRKRTPGGMPSAEGEIFEAKNVIARLIVEEADRIRSGAFRSWIRAMRED